MRKNKFYLGLFLTSMASFLFYYSYQGFARYYFIIIGSFLLLDVFTREMYKLLSDLMRYKGGNG